MLVDDQRYRSLTLSILYFLYLKLSDMPLFDSSAFLSPLSYFGLRVPFPSMTYSILSRYDLIDYLDCMLLIHHEAKVCDLRPWICKHTRSSFWPGCLCHAPPHLFATVIVMSQTGDHDIERGQQGESGVFSLPSEC